MNAIRIQNIIGFEKRLVNIKIKLAVLFYFIFELLKGEIKGKYFIRVLKRLLFFLYAFKDNKYVKIGRNTKINLYVPGFPAKAFFIACKKVLEFEKKMPDVTVLISVTSACRYKCPHCYQKYDKGKDMDIDILVDTVRKLQDKGVAFFNVEGGDPFLVYDKLKKVCDAIDERSEILINSTGDGMTLEKLQELGKKKNLLGIMFSLHTEEPEVLNGFMGSDRAWGNLERGIQLCHKVGIPVTFNTCLQKDAFYDGTFEKIMDKAKEFKGSILQLIKPKPAGGWLETGPGDFSEQDLQHIKEKVHMYNHRKEYKDYTFIAAMINEEDKSLFGCTAGATDRFYINAKGDLQPCEFLNISFGNIQRDDFDTIYEKMRKVFEKPGDCWLCEKYSAKVYELMKKHNLEILPLPEDLSKEIYKDWERGEIPEFYKKMEGI